MRSSASLLWKEWREVHWFLIAGAAIFIGWPLIEAVSNYRLWQSFYSDMPAGMVLLFGGFFAILVAAGATCRDLQGNIACFWQSRPVAIWRWVITKYLVGLAVILVVLTVPVLMQILMAGRADGSYNRAGGFATVLVCHTFTIILVYSLSFVAGCLIRSPVYAVIFSAALAMLVYFLPMLAPPLEGFSVFNIMMQSPMEIVKLSKLEQGGPWFAGKLRLVKIPWADDLALRYNIDLLRYIIFVVSASFVGVVVSWRTVKQNWRVKVGQKLMFWLVGGVAMLLFLTVVFQLGSNLKCIRQIPLKPGSEGRCNVEVIVCEGYKGVLLLSNRIPGFTGYTADNTIYSYLVTFDLSAKEPVVENVIIAKDQMSAFSSPGDRRQLVWSAKNPQWAYLIRTSSSKGETDDKWILGKVELLTVSLGGDEAVVIDKIDLLPHIEDRMGSCEGMCLLEDKVFVNLSGQVFVFDLGADGKPTLESATKKRVGIYGESGGRDAGGRTFATMSLGLIPAEGLNVEERLKAMVELTGYRVMGIEGGIVVETNNDFIKVFRLKEVRDDIATLEMVGYRSPTALERLAGFSPGQVFLRDGFAYVLNESADFGGVTVYDIREPQQIRRVGHYAVPNEQLLAIAPLPDGNILVGGNKLHIVAPPKAARAYRAQNN
jgi:ABC-type transport system involved in multi-copper enzyme maturation permease subunit